MARRRRLPSLNGLKAFEAAARHLSFRAAAEELGVTQGAVAQQVRALEAELGLRLFERRPRGVASTDAGRAYAAQVGRAFELVAEATAALQPGPRTLTVSVTPTFAAKWLIPRLPSFQAAHPDLELRIVASERLADFRTDGVDLAVRQGQPPFGPGLDAELLALQEVVAVGSPALVDRLGPAFKARDLGRVPLLHDAHDLWPAFAEAALGVPGSAPAHGLRFSQTSLAIDAAAAGHGLAAVSRVLVDDELRAGRLALAFEATLQGPAGFYVVTPRRSQQPETIAAVRIWLLERARAEQEERHLVRHS